MELTRQILKRVPEIELLETDWHAVPSASLGGASCSSCILDSAKLLVAGVKMRATEDALKSSLRRWRDSASVPASAVTNADPMSSFSDLDAMTLFEKLFARQT